MQRLPDNAHSTVGSERVDLATLSDEGIVERFKAGDLASLELIMRHHNQRIFRVVRSILGNDHDAEDVVQIAYVRAYEHLHQFEGRATFST